jgi:tartrate dehydrogenase/decarboxylase / D-malate dehydrogenase
VTTYKIAAIPGDGIGQEVMPGVLDLVERAAAFHQALVEWLPLDWSSDRYLAQGAYMPEDWHRTLSNTDAIFLGAVGDPRVPDHISLGDLLLAIRRGFRQSVNMRPIVSLPGVVGPLRTETPFDLLIVRENNEGEYTEIGGSLYRGSADEVVVQSAVFTRKGTESVIRFAFEQARKRRSDLVSATKSNGLVYSMPFWDRVAREVAADYPDVRFREIHIDALSARLVLFPEDFDVIVASNLFGDILSDLGAALMGSIGLAASANMNLSGDSPSMFEPVHGSAPDIAGKGIANPVGQVLTAAMMFDVLSEPAVASDLRDAVRAAVRDADGRTPDIGGHATTTQAIDRIAAELEASHSRHA